MFQLRRHDSTSSNYETSFYFAPKTAVTWHVIVKALAAGDARFKVSLYADELKKPIYEEEPTHLY